MRYFPQFFLDEFNLFCTGSPRGHYTIFFEGGEILEVLKFLR
jgi:hypothetical protein